MGERAAGWHLQDARDVAPPRDVVPAQRGVLGRLARDHRHDAVLPQRLLCSALTLSRRDCEADWHLQVAWCSQVA